MIILILKNSEMYYFKILTLSHLLVLKLSLAYIQGNDQGTNNFIYHKMENYNFIYGITFGIIYVKFPNAPDCRLINEIHVNSFYYNNPTINLLNFKVYIDFKLDSTGIC